MKVLAGLAAVVALWAQQVPPRPNAAKDADLVVVGELEGGAAQDLTSKVQVKALLAVARVLKGEAAAGARLPVEWDYRALPMEGPAVTTQPPKASGIWFLKRNGASWQPQPAALMGPRPLGGVYVPMPAGTPGAEWAAGPGAGGDERVARELGWALEALALKEGEGLTVSFTVNGEGGYQWRPGPAVLQFQRLSGVLSAMPQEASQGVYRQLAASPAAAARAAGIIGLLVTGDAGAALLLEKEAAAIARSPAAMGLGSSLCCLDLSKRPDAVWALARTAVGEVEIPNLEGQTAMQLGRARSLEALPYLTAMLESWSPSTRGSAVMGLCTLLRGQGPAGLWKDEMNGACPNRSPIPDPAEEARVVDYWKSWWAGAKPELEKKASLPQVRVPARYASRPPAVEARQEFPVERLFASISTGPARMFESRLSAEDYAAYQRVASETAAKVKALRDEFTRLMDRARVQGTRPGPDVARSFSERELQAGREGLDALRRELSGAGWSVVEAHFKEMLPRQ